MSPIPIVVCGKHPGIAKAVREGCQPEYDGMHIYMFTIHLELIPSSSVIHINLSVEEAISAIPHLLWSNTPANSTPNLGSGNYGVRPAAVALGGGFNDEMYEQIKASCGDEKMVWVRTDTTRKTEMPDFNDHEAYGKATAQRLKKCLDELKVGKEGGETEGMYWF
jgi:hypothetical protein